MRVAIGSSPMSDRTRASPSSISTFISSVAENLPGRQDKDTRVFMRIAIDYTAAVRQSAGVGNYVRRLVDAMLEQDTTNQYTLLTSGRPTRERPFPTASNVRGRSIVIPDRYLNIIWYRWRLPTLCHLFLRSGGYLPRARFRFASHRQKAL